MISHHIQQDLNLQKPNHRSILVALELTCAFDIVEAQQRAEGNHL